MQSALAALSAKMAEIANRPTVPPPQDTTQIPEPAPTPVSTAADLSHDNQKDSTDDAVDPLDNHDDYRPTTTTTTLPSTTLAGKAVPLPYQLEFAAFNAEIERMKRCDNTFAQTNHQTPPQTDRQLALAALSAKLAEIVNRPTVPPPPDATQIPEPAPTPVSTADDFSHDDDGNPRLAAQCQPSSIIDTFHAQAKMLRNLKMMVAELIGKVDLILTAILSCPKNSSIPDQHIARLLPSITICQTTDFPCTDHLLNPQLIPWPPHHATSINKLESKSSQYKTTIPAKPPFNRCRQTCHLVKTGKDSLHPP